MPTWIASGPGSDWLTATALRISSLVSHWRSCTSSFSIRPTSATGPPNPSVPRRRKYATISLSGRRCGETGIDLSGAAINAFSCSGSRCLDWWGPVVGLALAAPAPGIEGVVHRQPVLEHRVVVREICRKSERQREQARGLRRQVRPRRIGTPDDDG